MKQVAFFLSALLGFNFLGFQCLYLPVSADAISDPCTVVKLEPLKGPIKLASPSGSQYLINDYDKKQIFQIFVGTDNAEPICISDTKRADAPSPNRDKFQAMWHPSGRWIISGGEKDKHDLQWLPRKLRQGFLECGIWMDMYAISPDGNLWYKLQTMQGFTGPAITPDGKKFVWAEVIGPVSLRNPFGKWVLKLGDFIENNGVPSLVNVHDITPANTNWIEPGNFHPNGKEVLVTADTGLSDAHGQDQFILDIYTGRLTNLTNSPRVWDEHGLFSPDGKKVTWMSSYPYKDKANSFKILGLKTEFMLMNADGTDIRQLTHFQQPGYPEYRKAGSTPAIAFFNKEGTELTATRLLSGAQFPNYDLWKIVFAGACGDNTEDNH